MLGGGRGEDELLGVGGGDLLGEVAEGGVVLGGEEDEGAGEDAFDGDGAVGRGDFDDKG